MMAAAKPVKRVRQRPRQVVFVKPQLLGYEAEALLAALEARALAEPTAAAEAVLTSVRNEIARALADAQRVSQ
jgi:hypothetical protein